MKWEQSNVTDIGFKCVCFGNGLWVAGCSTDFWSSTGNGIYYSVDGKNWVKSNFPDYGVHCIYYADGVWVAGTGGSHGAYYSTDGKTWSQSNITGTSAYSLYNANGYWEVACTNGIWYSTTGKSWIKSNRTTAVNFVYYANGLWVAGNGDLAGSGMLYSTNGTSWSTVAPAGTAKLFTCCLNANGLWVLGSSSGIYYSTDGKAWTQSNITTTEIQDICYSNGLWVASTNFNIYYSTDGKTWSSISASGTTNYGIVCENSVWVCCNSKTLQYSFDGKTWVKSNITSGGSFYSACNANGLWVATSFNTGLYYSPTWEPTIPAGEYMFSAAPGSPALNPTELGNVTLTETINFISNDENHSTMTAKHIHS